MEAEKESDCLSRLDLSMAPMVVPSALREYIPFSQPCWR